MDIVGLEKAEFLANRGKSVSVVEMMSDVGIQDIDTMTRMLLMERLEEQQVQIRCNCEVKAVTLEGVDVVENGTMYSLITDNVVMAMILEESCAWAYVDAASHHLAT